MTVRHRRVSPLLWDDEQFADWPDDLRILWMVLLTGPQVLPCPGLQNTGPASVAETLRRPFETVSKRFRKLIELDRIQYDDRRRVVRIMKAPSYNTPENPNQIVGWYNTWKGLPDSPLKYDHIPSLFEVIEPLGEPFQKAWDNSFGTVPKPFPNGSPTVSKIGSREWGVGSREWGSKKGAEPTSLPKPESELKLVPPKTEEPSDVEAVFDYWREKLSPKAKLDSKREKVIRKALELYSVEELCKAVDGTLLDDWRMGRDPRTEGKKYIGVELVFRDAEKIDPMIAKAEEEPEFTGWEEPPPPPEDPPGTVYPPAPPEFLEALERLKQKQAF